MSLRWRLTVLYTLVLAGSMLLLGVAISVFFNFQIYRSLDRELGLVAELVWENATVNTQGDLAVNRLALEAQLPPELAVLVLDRHAEVIYRNSMLLSPDRNLLMLAQPQIRPMHSGAQALRVLTVPLQTSNRPVGVLQVGVSSAVANDLQRSLLPLIFGCAIAFALLAAGVIWLSTRQLLAPLEFATQVAAQITKADDLSRRIPLSGPGQDEIGQLILAFNDTLGRLEGLFNSQRRFLADVGHELRTPLTVIKGNTSLMRRMGCGDEESLESIESEVDRLTRMVGDLLLLAQAESGKLPLNQEMVDLDTLLLEAMSQMSVLAGDKVTLKLGEIDQVLVCGDRDRLKQVMVNLIGNAIGYTQAGEVRLSLGKAEGQARLTVTDTGPGIPPEDLPHIFERFYRGEKARTRSKTKGFGLGLSIVYWIVRNHQGRIDVASTVGQGTTFCIWLPLAQGETNADCQSLAAEAENKKGITG